MKIRWHSGRGGKGSAAKVLRDRPWIAFDALTLLKKKKKKTNRQKPKKR